MKRRPPRAEAAPGSEPLPAFHPRDFLDPGAPLPGWLAARRPEAAELARWRGLIAWRAARDAEREWLTERGYRDPTTGRVEWDRVPRGPDSRPLRPWEAPP